MNDNMRFPPGLRQLQREDGLTDPEMKLLADAASTMRGKIPSTAAEWREILTVIRRLLDKGVYQ